MPLEHISWGLVLSHLAECYRELADALGQARPDLKEPLARLRGDPVFRFLRGFRPAVADAPGLACLREQLSAVERAARARCEAFRRADPNSAAAAELSAAVNPFVVAARAFADSYSPRWDAASYFILPVYVTGRDHQSAALTYLRRFDPAGGPAGAWNLVGLTQDAGLQQINRNYFEQVANVVMGVLYGTDWQRPHADPYRLRSEHVYKLAFNCEITAGRSHGGALLALFTLAYLNSTLGANYLNYVRPAPGTVISAVVEPDGRIAQVSHAAEKVAAALAEYGPGIRVILPAENKTPQLEELGQHLLPGHLRFVTTAQELVAAALFPDAAEDELNESDERKYVLNEVRGVLLQQLGAPAREALYDHLRPEVSRHGIDRLLGGDGPAVGYTAHRCGVLSRIEFTRPLLWVRLGFEESAFAADELPHPQLVILALDGSEAMDHAWEARNNGTCLITDVVAAAARRLHERPAEARCDLAVAFLSTDQILPIEPGAGGAELEGHLQQFRATARLRFRGAFLRPVAELLAARFRHRTKRLCVVSDGPVYDHDDLEEAAFSSRVWFTLRGNATDGRVSLCPQGELSEAALDAQFAASRDVFRRVVLPLGQDAPLAWQPATGVLSRALDRNLELTFPLSPEAASFVACVQLAGWTQPSSFAVRGEMVRQGVPAAFRFRDYVVPGRCPSLAPPRRGKLSASDFDRWQKEGPTPKEPRLGLASLPAQPGGYYLLESGRDEWLSFRTGADLGEAALVILQGVPHCASRGVEPAALPSAGNHYPFDHKGRRLFVVPG